MKLQALLDDHDLAEPIAKSYQEKYPKLEIKAWLDLATGMRFMVEAMDVYLYYIVGIILLALLFSILNTMLMAVLERVREIGMLMAVGMNKLQIFYMIMLENRNAIHDWRSSWIIAVLWFCELLWKCGHRLGRSCLFRCWFCSSSLSLFGSRKLFRGHHYGFDYVGTGRHISCEKALQLNPVEAIRKI